MAYTHRNKVAYSQYYRESANLFGDAVLDNIFRYFLAEYLHQYRTFGNASIVLSKNDCATKTTHSFHTVNARIPELERMGLVKLSGNICEVNFEYYASVVHLFTTSKRSVRNKIRAAFLSHDLDALRDLGLNDFKVNVAEEISELSKGSVQISEPYANLHNPMQNCIALCQKTYANLQNLMQNCIPSDASLLEVSDQEQTILLENLSKIAEGAPESDVDPQFYAILMKIGVQNALKNLCNFAEGGYAILQRGLCNFAEQKIIRKEKENKIRKNQDFLEQVELVEEAEQDEQSNQETFQQISQINISNNRAKHPLLPVQEVQEAISDIHNCLDSGLRLFLHEVWARIPDVLAIEEMNEPDEDDAEHDNIQFPYEGEPVAVNDARKELFAEAYKAVKNHIETGYIITDQDEQLPVNAELFDSAQILTIMGWDIQDLPDGAVYIISTNKIYNITQTISKERVARRGNGRVDVSEDREYQRHILLSGTNDELFEKLTPMEYSVYCFLDEFYELDDDCYVERRKTQNELRELRGQERLSNPESDQEIQGLLKVDIANFLNDLPKPHVSVEELVKMVAVGKMENNYLPLRGRIMFSASKIRHWNARNGLLSSIDPSDKETNTKDSEMATETK